MVDMVAVKKAIRGLIPEMKTICFNCQCCELDCGACPYMEEDQDYRFCNVPQILQDSMDTMDYQEELLKKATGITWKDGNPIFPHEEETEPKGKYNSIGKEELEKVLRNAGVFKGWSAKYKDDIERVAICEALGQEFKIEWWINICYLQIGHMQMMFHWVRLDTTWPWPQYRKELHFENTLKRWMEPADTVAVLGVEYWPDYLEKHPELRSDTKRGGIDE